MFLHSPAVKNAITWFVWFSVSLFENQGKK